MNGKILGIYVAPKAGDPMQALDEVVAEANKGLVGDRYLGGNGSWNKGRQGKRQVTLINGIFFPGSGFEYQDCRRNLITEGVELMWLIGQDFQVGEAMFRGVKYCDPCMRPSKLAGKSRSFQEAFYDRGGLIAEVLQSGLISVGDAIIPPKKGY